jgi:UDP-N-acetyl-D-mannosaminuronate dehydrogenase
MMRLHKVLIVGYGEVGKPLYEIVRGIYPDVDWLDVEEKKIEGKHDVMHITFPEQSPNAFIASAVRYINEFSPELALIETTVTPGTTYEISRRVGKGALVCHSPVRGNITEGMKRGLLQYTKFIGPTSKDAGIKAKEYYETLGLKTHVCSSPLETELGKLFETTYRGLMMSWFQEIHRLCGTLHAQYDEVVEFVGSTEREGKQARPVFHPGVIGGHCIIPNAEKLYSASQSKFVEALLESNRARKQEVAEEGR